MNQLNNSCYLDLIDKTKTRNEVIKWLNFLSLFNEPELINYLHYSKSIIDISHKNSNYSMDNKYLDIIEKNDVKAMQIKKIISAIESLNKPERNVIKAKYIDHLSHTEICELFCISESTFKRRLSKGYIHLAMKLGIEVLKK